LQVLGRNEEAIAASRESLDLGPNHAAAHSNLGLLLLEAGQLDEALTHSPEAVALDPSLPEVHLNLGLVLKRLGRLPEAGDASCRVLALDPDLPEVSFNLASLLYLEGQHGAALPSQRLPPGRPAARPLRNFVKTASSSLLFLLTVVPKLIKVK
jgi:Flp pilus assembly protein TadD